MHLIKRCTETLAKTLVSWEKKLSFRESRTQLGSGAVAANSSLSLSWPWWDIIKKIYAEIQIVSLSHEAQHSQGIFPTTKNHWFNFIYLFFSFSIYLIHSKIMFFSLKTHSLSRFAMLFQGAPMTGRSPLPPASLSHWCCGCCCCWLLLRMSIFTKKTITLYTLLYRYMLCPWYTMYTTYNTHWMMCTLCSKTNDNTSGLVFTHMDSTI